MTKPCYPTLYEERLLRSGIVEDPLANENDDKQNRQERNSKEKSQLLFSATMAARVGRTETLLCALMDNKCNANDSRAIAELMHQTVLEVNGESMEAQWRPGFTKSAAGNYEPANEKDVERAVDAFFDDFPECRREDLDLSSDEDESDDENDLKQDKRSEPPSVMYPATKTNIEPHPVPQRNPYARQPKQSHVGEPGSLRPPTNRKQYLPQTTNTAPQGWDEVESFSYGSTSQSTAIAPKTWGDTEAPLRPTPTHRSQADSMTIASINVAPSWESAQKKQNPFQSALEYVEAGGDANDAEDNQLEGEYRRNSSFNKVGTRQAIQQDNPYQQTAQQHTETQSRIRGPNIPDSLKRKFQPPKRNVAESQSQSKKNRDLASNGNTCARPSKSSSSDNDDEELPEALHGLDKELIDKIQNEIIETGESVTFDDIAGLADAKQTVLELVCWPMKRPDLFTGLRRGPNGLLLFGPPGTGKTLIGKAIAHESGACFFSISSSSLTSKWIGEGEKLVRTLFAVAAYKAPAVVFIDEIDSLLTQRKADENEASRRIKTEFLVQLDGTGTSGQGLVLVIGATNRPHELDDAARRRFVKRLYIPLPAQSDRGVLLHTLLAKNRHLLTENDLTKLSCGTEGFSGADLKALCTDAAMGPIRELGARALDVAPEDVPPISYKHFRQALRGTKPSVAQADLDIYLEWNKTYGSKNAAPADEDDDSDSEDSANNEVEGQPK